MLRKKKKQLVLSLHLGFLGWLYRERKVTVEDNIWNGGLWGELEHS